MAAEANGMTFISQRNIDCPDEDKIVKSGGNLVECFNAEVYEKLIAQMNAEGVPFDAICSGGVAF